MTRKMGDSSVLDHIPLDVDIVGLYFNGEFAVDPGVAAKRFPPSKYVTVWYDVFGNAPQHCQLLDVEAKAGTVARTPGWVRDRRAAVHTSLPTLYVNRSNYAAVVRTCSVGGLVLARDYQIGVSTLDGTQTMDGRALHTIPGVVFCQLQGGPKALFDLSVVYDDEWHPLAKLDPKRRAEAPDRSPPRSAPGPHCFT